MTPEVPAAPAAPGPNGNRKRILAPLTVMAAGLLIVLIGVGAMLFTSAQTSLAAGEATTVGIVTSLGSQTSDGCSPIVRFAAEGKSLSTSPATPLSPCPLGLGQSVPVVYTVSDAAGSGHIVMLNPIEQYLWLVPVVGVVVLLGGFIGFIVRAGTIVSGVRIIRDGEQRRRRTAASGELAGSAPAR